MPSLKTVLRLTSLRFIGYFLLLLMTQMIMGLGRTIGFGGAASVPISAKPDTIISAFGPADYATYVHAAEGIRTYGIKIFQTAFATTPPGLPIVESIILKLWHNPPLYAVLFALILCLWSAYFVVFSRILEKLFSVSSWIAFMAPLMLLAATFFRNDYVWDSIGLTESFATPCFGIACFIVIDIMAFPKLQSWRSAVVAGFLFAAASYIRAQFDFTFIGLATASAACLFAKSFDVFLIHRSSVHSLKAYALALLACFVTYNVATVPYKIYRHAPTIVVIDYAWSVIWYDKSEVDQMAGGMFRDAGLESVCVIAPVKCQEFHERRARNEIISFNEYRKTAVSEVLHNPVSLLRYKLPYFWRNWFIDMWGLSPDHSQAFVDYVKITNLVLLLVMPFGILYLLWRRWEMGVMYAIYCTSFIVACTVFSLFIHIEARYFLPIKLFSATTAIVLITDAAILLTRREVERRRGSESSSS